MPDGQLSCRADALLLRRFLQRTLAACWVWPSAGDAAMCGIRDSLAALDGEDKLGTAPCER